MHARDRDEDLSTRPKHRSEAIMNRADRRRAQRTRDLGAAALRRPAGPLDRAASMVAEGRYAEAEDLCRQVLVADPSSDDAHRILAQALREQGRRDEAMLAARRATTFAPRSAAAHTELGAVLADQDRVVEALRSFERAIELDPDHADAHNRYGAAMLDLGQLDQALVSFRRVARLLPDHPAHHANIAVTLNLMGDYHAALRAHDRAVALEPDAPRLRYNRSFARLATGDLVGGWEDHEFGFAAGERKPDRRPPVTRWDGSDLSGKRVLVWREQGLGDEVRFASCYGELIDRAGHVVIECTDRLIPLFRRAFPRAVVRRETADPATGHETADLSDIDVHVPAGSLPRFLRRSLGDFPRHDGYLVADAQERERWRTRLSELGDALKVGLAWRSGNLKTSRLQHYLTLEELAPLLHLDGIRLVNLQYGPGDQLESELRELEERSGVVVHRWDDVDYTADLDAVAALTAELDVVIGPASFPTVLAGALGVPALVLTAPTPWTLGHASGDPWFPASRPFIRTWNEPWQRAVDEAAEHLRHAVGSRSPQAAP